jgi:hypothetical protein
VGLMAKLAILRIGGQLFYSEQQFDIPLGFARNR